MERSIRNLGDPHGSCRRNDRQVNPIEKEGDRRLWGSRISSQYSEGGRAVHMGKGLTVIRSLQRKHLPGV
jgi:hypothetical protein